MKSQKGSDETFKKAFMEKGSVVIDRIIEDFRSQAVMTFSGLTHNDITEEEKMILEEYLDGKIVVDSEWLKEKLKNFPQGDDDEFADYDCPDDFYNAFGRAVNKWINDFEKEILEALEEK